MPDSEVNAETRVSDEKEAAVRKPYYDRAVAAVRRVMGIPWSVAAAAALDASGVWDRIEQLERVILDIDAHAAPLAEDADGFITGGYVITVGSLHRALGVVGHSAALCSACDVAGARP